MRSTHVRYLVLGGLCLLGLIAYIHRVGFGSAGTDLKLDLRISDQDWGIIMAAFLTAYAVFEVPWGILGDRFGAKVVLIIVTLGWSLLTAALALVAWLPPSTAIGLPLGFLVLFLLRFLFGLFQAGAFPAISRVIADWIPVQERGTAQGVLWMCCRMGGALAPFLLLALIYGLGGWPEAFVAVALLGVLWCAGFWPLFRNRPDQVAAVGPVERELIARGRARTSGGHAAIPWGEMLHSSSVWALCLMYGFCGFSANFFITMLPAYLREHRHLPAETMTWLQGLPLACGVVGCLAGGLISDLFIRWTGNRAWGRRLSGLLGHALAGCALLATNWVQETWMLGLLLSVTFFCNDLAMGPAWASCADIGERYAGTLGGTMNTVGNLGGAVGTLVAGYLLGKMFLLGVQPLVWEVAGNDLVFIIFAGSFWLAAVCWLGVDVTKPLGQSVVKGKAA